MSKTVFKFKSGEGYEDIVDCLHDHVFSTDNYSTIPYLHVVAFGAKAACELREYCKTHGVAIECITCC